ncbi:MAG TPA: shikimate dehydrogenase [Rhodospirillaceae bacterium]|nr:shikimate dehydrogenase [Rhodospirillaceae bacterium]
MILSGKARLAGVLGWPVGHSRSPRLHGYWLKKLAIDGAYLPLPVKPEDFALVLRALPRMGFAGANVTVPHKETAMALVDHLDPLAKRIGAVNTLVVRADGGIEGHNTDAFGFLENLRQDCPVFHPDHAPAVVLGAGGAARAVVAALTEAGTPQIRLLNRHRERAERLAAELGGAITVIDWERREAALEGIGLLVNTTSLGMTGQPPLDLDLAALPGDALVNDIVYAPMVTDLLRHAGDRGNPVVGGLGMLLHQARAGFAAWFGVMPEVTADLRKFVEGE